MRLIFFFFFFGWSTSFYVAMFNGETSKLPTGIDGYKQSMRTTQIARGSQHDVPKLVLVSDSYDAFWHRRARIVNIESILSRSVVRGMSDVPISSTDFWTKFPITVLKENFLILYIC